jgi:hypothetical protein
MLIKSFVNYIDLTRIYRDILKYRLITIRIVSNILFSQQLANNFVIKFIEILIYNRARIKNDVKFL